MRASTLCGTLSARRVTGQPVLLVAAAYSGGSFAPSPVLVRELVEICELQFAAMAGDDVPIPVDRSPT